MKYLDNNGFQEQDKGGNICVIKGKDENIWDKLKKGFVSLPFCTIKWW
jgi:hypothetical protein